jgi:uncharacterized membrane protein
MNMLASVVAWVSGAVVFVGMDAVWLGIMTPRLYRPALGEHLAPRFDLIAASAFYLLYITGLVVLAVMPAVEKHSLTRAVLLGAMVGLQAYGAYDLTNQATLIGWDFRLSLADMTWGAIASGIAAGCAYAAASRTL